MVAGIGAGIAGVDAGLIHLVLHGKVLSANGSTPATTEGAGSHGLLPDEVPGGPGFPFAKCLKAFSGRFGKHTQSSEISP